MAEDNYTNDASFREHYGWVTSPSEAAVAAKTVARRIERSKRKVAITMPGTNAIVAGMVINLAEFRPQLNGRYKVIVVHQSLTRGGWITMLTCEGAAQ